MPNHTGRFLTFATEEDAWEYLRNYDDDGCVDQKAIGYEDDPASMEAYLRIREGGCCGSFDADVIIAGRKARIGCNYGH